MAQKTVEIVELNGQLNEHIQNVQEGATLVITDQGKPVAKLLPFSVQEKPAARGAQVQIEEKLRKLVESGVIEWSGQRLSPEVPRVPLRGTKTVSELLLEDRD